MALTQEHVQKLTAPFAAADHEFIRGYVYISELAITTRLDDVDPSWTFEVLSNIQRDRQMVATARMTIAGIFRDGVGMQTMEYLTEPVLDENGNKVKDKNGWDVKQWKRDEDGKPIDAGEAEKGAPTDALRRCARLFGIGRYLLDNPPKVSTNSYGDVTDRKAFDKWLSDQQKAHAAKWGQQQPSKIAGHIEPDPEADEQQPEQFAQAAGAEGETPFREAKKVDTPLNKAMRPPVVNKPGPAFGQWTKKHGVKQAEALEALGVKSLAEWQGSIEDMLEVLRNHFGTNDEGKA